MKKERGKVDTNEESQDKQTDTNEERNEKQAVRQTDKTIKQRQRTPPPPPPKKKKKKPRKKRESRKGERQLTTKKHVSVKNPTTSVRPGARQFGTVDAKSMTLIKQLEPHLPIHATLFVYPPSIRMIAFRRHKEKNRNCLAVDTSMGPGFKIFTDFLLLTLVCHGPMH